MSYIAIKNFSVNEKEFKIGDAIPTMFVQDRLIRAKKIKLASDAVEVKEVPAVTAPFILLISVPSAPKVPIKIRLVFEKPLLSKQVRVVPVAATALERQVKG